MRRRSNLALEINIQDPIFDPKVVDGCILWLGADSLDGLSDGAGVSNWYDKSGYGHNAVAVNAPTFKKDYFGIGRHGVYFNAASSQYMSIARTADLEPTAGFTIISVLRSLGGYNYATLIKKPYRTSGWSEPYVQWDASVCSDSANEKPYVSFGYTSSNHRYVISSYACRDSFGIYTFYYNKSVLRLYMNGVLWGTVNYSDSIDYTNATDVAIGTRSTYSPDEPLNAVVAELIMFNAGLSTSNLNTILSGLNKKYGIPVSVVS